VKLTPAQERELLNALRAHPAHYLSRSTGVATRLCAAGLLLKAGEGAPPSYVLSRQGLDQATRLTAQRLIDSVNDVAAKKAAQGPAAAPKNWPFPVSGHQW
jgi:hypothetical protein